MLIGWDGADWEHIDPLLDEGLLPGLASLIARGARGNLASLQPMLSPMLWNSIATGKLPDKHGIHGFTEPDPYRGGIRAASSFSRTSRALWNILTLRGMRSNVVGWWASHPAEPILGNIVTNGFNGIHCDSEHGWQVRPGTIHPESRTAELARLRVLPEEIVPEQILPFIPEAARIDQVNDKRLRTFCELLSDCASVQAVTTKLLEEDDWDLTAVYFDSIDHFCHGFMNYHPPQMENVTEEDFSLYRDVIRGAYQFHDMLLQRQLQLAGPDATVVLCSDHGFQSGGRRPLAMPREPAGPAVWHRHYGIAVMAGPGIRQGATIEGACLTDIAPTILHLLGLPLGSDMDGRVLVGALRDPAPPCTIASWDDLPGDCGMRKETATAVGDEDKGDHLLHHFVALGYIDDPGPDKDRAAESSRIELNYNLARVYLSTHRSAEALPLLTGIVRERPWESRFWSSLAHCCLKQGYLSQAESILQNLYSHCDRIPSGARLLQAAICEANDERLEALEHLETARQQDSANSEVLTAIGRLHLVQKNYAEAEAAFRSALSIHPESPIALQGLSSVHLRRHENQDALDTALEALSLLPHLPKSQLNCGIALARLGHPKLAIQAFQRLLEMNALTLVAHRWLAALYRQELEMPAMADFHRDQARSIRSHASTSGIGKSDVRSRMLDLPDIPPIAERLAVLERERPLPKTATDSASASFSLKQRERVIVSGLPRSGTSLMMRMLATGGLEAMTDGARSADFDNPKGYFEWEPVKRLASDPSVIDHPDLDTKAVKVVSMLLPHLPKHRDYRIIFMLRPTEEVLKSQMKMLTRVGGKMERLPDADDLEKHRDAILSYLRTLPNVELLTIDYPEMIAAPDRAIEAVIDFLGSEHLPVRHKMAAAIVPELYRNRSHVLRTT